MNNSDLCWMSATDLAAVIAPSVPIGLQIVGRRFDDVTVLRASAAFEAAHPWAQRRPAVG